MENQYIPGVCNINASEVQKRRKIGFIGLIVLFMTLVALFLFKLPAPIWLITFVPGFLMATGFLQAKNKFCVGYAAAGMRHTATASEKVPDQKWVDLDKKRARKINLHAMSIGVSIAVASVVLGLLLT